MKWDWILFLPSSSSLYPYKLQHSTSRIRTALCFTFYISQPCVFTVRLGETEANYSCEYESRSRFTQVDRPIYGMAVHLSLLFIERWVCAWYPILALDYWLTKRFCGRLCGCAGYRFLLNYIISHKILPPAANFCRSVLTAFAKHPAATLSDAKYFSWRKSSIASQCYYKKLNE